MLTLNKIITITWHCQKGRFSKICQECR